MDAQEVSPSTYASALLDICNDTVWETDLHNEYSLHDEVLTAASALRLSWEDQHL